MRASTKSKKKPNMSVLNIIDQNYRFVITGLWFFRNGDRSPSLRIKMMHMAVIDQSESIYTFPASPTYMFPK
jgi:hypothetical protein